MPSQPGWTLNDFLPRFDAWVAQDSPPEDLVMLGLAWILTRGVDPYIGARRADGFANLWFAPVPRTLRDGRMLTCSYFVFESRRDVTCNGFAMLATPF